MCRMLMLVAGFFCIVFTGFAADGDLVSDLRTVRGIEEYDGPDSGKALLAKNGFVVVPRFYHRIFGPYLEPPLPPYVTADSVHRTFHTVFEEELQRCEEKARDHMGTLVGSMLVAMRAAPDTELRQLGLDYFHVAYCLLQGKGKGTGKTVEQELALIRSASGIANSPLFGYKMDYTQFAPGGFYTKTPTLKNYFRAMTWFGKAAFRLKSERETRAAMLIAAKFAKCADARDAWDRLNTLYSGLLFECDDLTIQEYAGLLEAASSQFEAFQKAAWGLRDPEYSDMVLWPGADLIRESKGMRFMGKRYLPDGGVFAAVTDPKVPGRFIPTVLDVLAANGAARARTHLESAGAQDTHLAALNSAGEALTAAKAQYANSPYMQTLEVMAALTAPPIDKAAAFAKTPAYADKSLMTAAAIWASTRHAWILHGKQNARFACMSLPIRIPGYIEPKPAFFDRMTQLNATTLRLLRNFDRTLGQPLERLTPFLETLSEILEGQLEGRTPSDETRFFFEHYWARLVSLQGHRTNAPVDKSFPWMALVADVFTEYAAEECVEAATGGAMPIYAVVEADGNWQLLLGGVYSFYEFGQPIAERLTDEAWHERLDAGRIPSLPGWTSSFMAGTADVEAVLRRLAKGETVPEATYIDDPRLDAFLREAIHQEGAMDRLSEPGNNDSLLDLAVMKIPSDAKPVLMAHLRTMTVPDYERMRAWLDGTHVGETVASIDHTAYDEAEDRVFRMTRLLGPWLDAQDLEVLGNLIETGGANRATAVLRVSYAMKKKAAERLWVRALAHCEGKSTRRVACTIIQYRASKDITPDLLAQLRISTGEKRDALIRLLKQLWEPLPAMITRPRFDTNASQEELEAWWKELRKIIGFSFPKREW